MLPLRPHSLDPCWAGWAGALHTLPQKLFHLINSELCDLILVSKPKYDTVPRYHSVSTGRVLVTLLRTAVRLVTLPFALLVAFLRTSFMLGTSVEFRATDRAFLRCLGTKKKNELGLLETVNLSGWSGKDRCSEKGRRWLASPP